MATWKKVIVSGSAAELASLTLTTDLGVADGGTGVSSIGTNNFLVGTGATSVTTLGSNGSGTVVRTTGATGLSVTGSFTGSFKGDGSGLTGFGTTTNSLVDGNGITNFTFDGSSPATVSVELDGATLALAAGGISVANAGITATQINTSVAGAGLSGGAGTPLAVNVDDSSIEINTDTLRVKAAGVTNTMLTNSTVVLGSTSVALGATATTLAGLTLTGLKATGSFTGSFIGDGSGLTGLVSTLNIDGDSGGPGTVDLLTQTLDIAGGTNITTALVGQTITVTLDDNVTVDDLVVNGDLTVFGTASFADTVNLLVADRFVLFASGSTTVGDGGIVVQQGTQNIGDLLGYDGSATRWGVDTAFNATLSTFTPSAYISAVVDIDAGHTDISRYEKNGNIKVQSGVIYIYS